MSWKIGLGMAIIALASIVRVSADEMVLEQFYGNGVHAFNDGDLTTATEAFTMAINGGSRDPRVFYFRGLALERMGREPDAKADFEKGAALEAADAANVTLVSRSMERIQGRQRQMLEQYRTVVRAAALARKQATDRAVRQAIAQEELNVRRKVQPIELPSNPEVSPSMSTPPQSPGQAADVNPFEVTPAPTPERQAAPAARQDQQPEVNPFEAQPAGTMPKATTPAEANPFGETPAKSTPKPADNDNPFGEAPKTAPTPNTKPADADNPFGDAPAKPAPKPAEADNPFGATTPAGSRTAPSNNNPTGDRPAPGAIAGLFHAFVEGARPDEPSGPPPLGPGMDISGMIHGMLGNTTSPPGAVPPTGAQDFPMPDSNMPAAQAPPMNRTAPTPPQPAAKPSDNPFD